MASTPREAVSRCKPMTKSVFGFKLPESVMTEEDMGERTCEVKPSMPMSISIASHPTCVGITGEIFSSIMLERVSRGSFRKRVRTRGIPYGGSQHTAGRVIHKRMKCVRLFSDCTEDCVCWSKSK